MSCYSLKDFWPAEPSPASVNSVFESKGRDLGLTRDTLTKARDGVLKKTTPDKVMAMLRLASEWAGREVQFTEIVSQKENSCV